jgi:hypothetical protein
MPATSQNQQQAAGMALAVKRGKIPVSELYGAALQMYKTMTATELRHFAETKRKGLPERKGNK